MTILMSVALALAAAGAATTASAYRLAPALASNDRWGLAFMGGISLVGFGALGAMTLLLTA